MKHVEYHRPSKLYIVVVNRTLRTSQFSRRSSARKAAGKKGK